MWDLHVHTPDSMVQEYRGPEDVRWPRFLDALEDLNPDIRVLGINDYWFLDGYKKIRDAKESGRLSNIDELFPVIEVRCDTFSGTDSSLKRLNVHLILDPAVPVADLEQQLRSVLRARYRLTDDGGLTDWNEVPTRESMARLGKRIISSTPPEKQNEFANSSEEQVGFNNLNVSFEGLVKGIADNSFLRDHVILALGKVEWESIRWNVASIAQKKTLVNSVDALFTAAKTRASFSNSLNALKLAKVKHRLLDCSDAHTWAEADTHTRLGYCFTWVNADPTFKGLKQALQEYDQRITCAERPDVLTRMAQSPRSVITDVSLRPLDGSNQSPVFSSTIPLNAGFVAVIGNKGQGKSALLDSIALAANSDRHEDFSFLNAKRFRAPGSLANEYQVEIRWADLSIAKAAMSDGYSSGSPVRVDYLPQSLIEKVCSADPNSATKQEFEAEIERVVFRHIDDTTRGGATNLKQLLEIQGAANRTALSEARGKVDSAADELTSLRRRREELTAMDLPARKVRLQEQVAEVSADLESVSHEIAVSGTTEQQAQAAELRSAREHEQLVEGALKSLIERQDEISLEITEVDGLRERLKTTLAHASTYVEVLSTRVGLAADSLLEVSFEEAAVDGWIDNQRSEHLQLSMTRTSPGGLDDQLAVARQVVRDKESALQSLNDDAQAMLTRQSDLHARMEGLLGAASEVESMRGIEALEAELSDIGTAMSNAEACLEDAFGLVHAALLGIKNLQRTAYERATQFVEANVLAKEVQLAFGVEFRVREF